MFVHLCVYIIVCIYIYILLMIWYMLHYVSIYVYGVCLLKYRPLYILAQDSRWSEQRSWKTSGAGGLLDIICESGSGAAAPVAGFLGKCAR